METGEVIAESQGPNEIRSKLVEVETIDKKDLRVAIFTCAFCFFPTGIFAIIAARNARKYAALGDTEKAKKSSRRAKILTYISLYFGLFGMALALVLVLVEYHTSVFSRGT